MIRVLVVDDHAVVREGLARLLGTADDIEVVGIAAGGDEALILDADLRPDVVLLDVSMPGLDGPTTADRLIRTRPEARVVMLSAHLDRGHVMDALDAGAVGYLAKDADPRDLVAGVRSAASGDVPLDPRAGRAILESRRAAPAAELTDREQEVLTLVAQGLSNKLVARRLGISEKTVKAHLTRIFSTIGVTDRTQAAMWHIEHGDPAGRR